jgi:hypothetical protein
MFERFTEKARRTIFFARYEASLLGSRYIETEHLLLGLLREDRPFRDRLPAGAADQIRKRIEESAPQPAERAATSVDIPLSADSKKALVLADEESKALQHSSIDCGHLLLGLLLIETSVAAVLLNECGIAYVSSRAVLAEPPPAPTAPESIVALPAGVAAGPLAKAASDLQQILRVSSQLRERGGRLKRNGWTRKEAVGHLIDWAAAHQQWFARALAEPKVTASGYPEDSWLAAQHYNELPWRGLLEIWGWLNRLILHVIFRIPEDKLDVPCRIGIAQPIPLRELVNRYVAHCEDIVGQLLMLG